MFATGEVPEVNSETFENVLLLCEAAGTLYYLGEEAHVQKWHLNNGVSIITAVLQAWPADEFQQAYEDFLKLERQLPSVSIPSEHTDESLQSAFFEEIVACLRPRDRIQLIAQGANTYPT